MIAIIAAIAKNGVIGTRKTTNGIPWENMADQKRFLELTRDKVMLMGKTTFEINYNRLGRPFKSGRKTIVMTTEKPYPPAVKFPESVFPYDSIDKALEDFKGQDIFIVGGANVYEQTMDKADTMYITWQDQDYEGDVYFPKISTKEWTLESEEIHPGYRFAVYKKIQS